MQNVHLKINEKVFDRFLALLREFDKGDIEIISSNTFSSTKEYLENELKDIESGDAKFLSQSEFEERLKSVFDKYEDRL